jgi:hypothetical protein
MARCSNCQFHNIPGTAQCGRCGGSLLLATAVIDISPPRAGKWVKAWRKTPISRQWRYVKSQWETVAERIDLDPTADLPGLNVLLRLVLPGWAQQVTGNAFVGRCLFAAYAVCVLLAGVLIGTTCSSFLIATALTVHAASVYDVAHRSTHNRGGRLSRFLLGCGILGFCLYIPAFSRVEQMASPVRIQIRRAPLMAGEVLVVNRTAYNASSPQPGDLVTYEIPDASYGGTVEGRNAIFLLRGQRIDRVLAGPGQSIRWRDGALTVDNNLSPWLPLNPKNVPAQLEFKVPAGRYLIFPSTETFDGLDPARLTAWQTWSSITVENIQGRIYWRSWPLDRMGFVR